MILIEFLLAPTVPSAPRPKNTARTTSAGSMSKLGSYGQREVGDVVDDADREVALRAAACASSSKTALTIAGVNSFDDSP